MSTFPPSPSFPSRFWSTLLLILAAFGIPVATLAVFTRYVTEHPLLAFGIWLLYEATVFILGFAGKVWQELENSWVKSTAKFLDHWIQGIISRYRKKYFYYLRYQHRDFDVKGLSTLGTSTLELDQVFVELRIDQTTAQLANVNPIQDVHVSGISPSMKKDKGVPQDLLESSHAIWEYLASTPLSNQHFVIIGPPGSGKTTLLKHITLLLVAHRKSSQRPHHVRISHKLPILLFLRDHVSALKEQSKFSLVDALHDHLKKWEQPTPPQGWVERQLTSGRCIVMLDGLDEVADPDDRQTMVNWVEIQMAAYRRNRFIVTSRPFGYRSNPLSGVTILEVRPFKIEQVERFIYKWYLANEIMSKQKNDPGVHMRAKAESRALLQQLYNTPALFALTVNPLLLTMIATVHRYGGELPGNRVALYAEICEVFLGKRQIARGQTLELNPAQMQLLLEPLACYLMIKGIREIAFDDAKEVIKEPLSRVSSQMTPEAFLRLVENASGLLLERENGVYSFAHLTFQEYLAATYIREKHLGQMLVERVGLTWWQETIRLYSAMADATPIIDACLASDHPSAASIELAIDCDKEAREVKPEMRIKLDKLLKQGIEDPEPERLHVIAGALLARRLRQMVHLKDNINIDTSLITNAEYQLFLDEQRARGIYLQPDHWTSYHFLSGQGNAPVLGVRPSDATRFCAWLTERDPTLWSYRLPNEDECKQVAKDGNLAVQQIPGTGYWIKDGEYSVWPKGTPLPIDDIIGKIRDASNTFRASVLGLDSALDYALDSAITSDRVSTLALDLTLASTLALDRAFASTLASTLAHTLDLICNRLSTTDRDLTDAFTDALTRARALASTHTNVLFANDRALALTRAKALESALEHACFLFTNGRVNDLTRASDLERALASTRYSAKILFLIFNLDRILEQIGRSRLRYADKKEQALSLLSSASYHSLDLVRFLSHWKMVNPFGIGEEDIRNYLDLYVAMVLLKLRIRGMLPAWEGILLVRERIQIV
jgi:energy-coupling factor transporter ATP-binding protein EcfA2